MRTVVAWQETPPEREGVKNICYDLAFSPDGAQLVAAVGDRVLVYDAENGDLLHVLKGHKENVCCVAYAANGKRFASGGADKHVIIWTNKGEGILKYTHSDSIQALAYNPVSQQLASATATDLGLWSPEHKAVSKSKVSSKVLCLEWTSDGAYLAMGCYDGSVSVRDKAGAEKTRIEVSGAPVWTLAWHPQERHVLAAACFDGALKFFTLSGAQHHKDKKLEHDPLSLSFFGNGEYMLIGGTDKAVQLYTREGTKLTQVAQRDSWVWAVKPRPKHNFVAVGCEDGSITVYQLVFSTVHGLYQQRYAYRESMTDVVVQHLMTENKVKIKCRDYVKKIAVYKDQLAVQLPGRIVIYQLSQEDAVGGAGDMRYQSATKIAQPADCNLLVVTSCHVILCQDKRLQLYALDGQKLREWMLDAVIRYIKVAGGPSGREGLLVGLKDGSVQQVFLDSAFPIPLLKHGAAIRCLDISCSRRRLALVDEASVLTVYDLASKAAVYSDQNVNSVAFNGEFDAMLCYTGGGLLSIKTGDFPLAQQKLPGFVVGFRGSKVFCLHLVNMQSIDVPQSSSMCRYLDIKDYATAYKVACLGVTEADWRHLAVQCLGAMQLELARKAFIRVRDVRSVELVNRTELRRKQGVPEPLLLAEVLANQGKFQDAAKLFTSAGRIERAMEMFSDLRQYDQATKWADEHAGMAAGGGANGDMSGVVDLIGKQAEWSEETNNFEAAAEMYIKAKKYDRAIAILAKHGWWDKLLGLVRQLDPKGPHARCLPGCATLFRKAGQFGAAKETLMKLGDTRALVALNVEERRWEDAFLLLHAHPEYKQDVYIPYAAWLSSADRFDEARLAYSEGGRPDLATRMLEQLARNATLERRFEDAAYYYYQLAIEALKSVSHPIDFMTPDDHTALGRFSDLYDRSDTYFAYSILHRAATAPFKSNTDSTVLNAARFVLMRVSGREPPPGVSVATATWLLAQQAVAARAYKLARNALTRLNSLTIPAAWQAEVEMQSLVLRSKPFTDNEDLLPVCYRCNATNPLLNTQGDKCSGCGTPFIRSFLTFEHLPLVEFELQPGISDSEAEQLIGEGASSGAQDRPANGNGPSAGGANVLTLDDPDDYVGQMDDPFAPANLSNGQPLRLDRNALRRLRSSEVLIRRWPCPHIPAQYFRIMDDEQPVCVGPCGHFFEEDEFEAACLEKGYAPLSKQKVAQALLCPPGQLNNSMSMSGDISTWRQRPHESGRVEDRMGSSRHQWPGV